jgi:hypothetical protein
MLLPNRSALRFDSGKHIPLKLHRHSGNESAENVIAFLPLLERSNALLERGTLRHILYTHEHQSFEATR